MIAATAPGRALPLPTTTSGRPILARGDLDAYDPRPRRSGGRDRYFCPIHGGDHQRSLSVDPQTGYYTCHSCGVKGTLREHWPDAGGKRRPARAPSIEEVGRWELAARTRADAARAERLAREIPADASSFLSTVDAMAVALREPSNPGATYLRGRGLDPELAASLGVGYSAPNIWPSDAQRARHERSLSVGRVVYPLADPLTGRVVSALGRLCVDARPAWPEEKQKEFKGLKQRKLAGCPAGIWPYASLAAAREQHRPVAFVEGPADALALRGRGLLAWDCEVVALIGTADVLPMASLKGVAGVVLALDADEGGARATRKLRLDLVLAGVPVETVRPGWLGLGDAKDPAELAMLALRDEDAAGDGFGCAFVELRQACDRLLLRAWDTAIADAYIHAMYERLGAAAENYPQPWPEIDLAHDAALDRAYEARDCQALMAAVEACEAVVVLFGIAALWCAQPRFFGEMEQGLSLLLRSGLVIAALRTLNPLMTVWTDLVNAMASAVGHGNIANTAHTGAEVVVAPILFVAVGLERAISLYTLGLAYAVAPVFIVLAIWPPAHRLFTAWLFLFISTSTLGLAYSLATTMVVAMGVNAPGIWGAVMTIGGLFFLVAVPAIWGGLTLAAGQGGSGALGKVGNVAKLAFL